MKLLFFIGIIFILSCSKEATSLKENSVHLFLRGKWNLVWHDEFSGKKDALPSDKWFFFHGWGENNLWRDSYYTEKDAYLDGAGHLLIRARVEHDTLKTSYLRTFDLSQPRSKWSTFGIGKGKYIEANIKLSDMVSGGLWVAFWLFATENEYDGNPSTGTEIDIMENIIAYGKEGSWIKDLPGGNSLNHFNVATHWGNRPEQSAGKLINAGDYGLTIHDDQYHRFGLRWFKGQLTYYLDEDSVFSITRGVSSSNNEALILSIEYDAPPNDAWGTEENVLEYLDRFPNYFNIDYVRVYSLEE